MRWETLTVGTWLLTLFAPNHHNICLLAFLPVTRRKANIGKGCAFQVFYTKQHFLQSLVHLIFDFEQGGRSCYLCDKCVVFAHNCKFVKSNECNMQYIPFDSALFAQETRFITQKSTLPPKSSKTCVNCNHS